MVVVSTDRKSRVVGNVAGTEFESERDALKRSPKALVLTRKNRTEQNLGKIEKDLLASPNR